MADKAQRYDSTRLALIRAFEGPGLPTNVFPDLDPQAHSDYTGELALRYFNQLPRDVRRANPDVVLDVIVRMLGLGFWGGAAYVVERDSESGIARDEKGRVT